MATTYYRGDVYRVPDQVDYTYSVWCSETPTATTTHAVTWTEWTCTSPTNVTPTASTTTNSEAWYYWTTDSTGAAGGYRHSEHDQDRLRRLRPQITPEQREQRERQQAENERRWAAERAEKQTAKDRADELLDANLTDAQRSDLARDGFFFVDSLKGNKYRIRRGRVANVDAMHKCGERVSHKLCAHPQLYVPDGDTMLAQKLMLEHNEDEFLRLANRS